MKKIKGSLISLLAFVAAAGFVHMPVLTAADDEATVQSSSVEVDWETVDWKEGLKKSRYPLSPEDAEIVWQRIQKDRQFQALPQVFKDLIEHNKDKYSLKGADVNTFSLDKCKRVGGGLRPKIFVLLLVTNLDYMSRLDT